jgi:membrane-bound lytic murein transglycosylase A
MSLFRRILFYDALISIAIVFVLWQSHCAPVRGASAESSASWLRPAWLDEPDSVAIDEKPATAEPAEKIIRNLSPKVLVKNDPDTLPYIPFDPPMLQAMTEQADYLQRSGIKTASGISKKEMLKTIQLLQGSQLLDPNLLLSKFDFYRIQTDMKSDRVRITGYYTPLIKATRIQSPGFDCPMLKKPEQGPTPSPAEIETGALAGRGLELAWLSSKKELSNAQLQGSCLIEFPDGKRQHFGFGGAQKGAGGTYVFFTPVNEQVIGSGFFPLTAGYSIAVDPKYIPVGSTLLAELPDLDVAGRLKGYTYRILFAQDRGGAILTTKRIDLYCGIGNKGLQEARIINGIGRLWLMLPKANN